MIYITGDTHGGSEKGFDKLNSSNFKEGKSLTKSDYVIICGDFGLIWYGSKNAAEEYWIDWLNKKPWTTLFVDGNHENFERLLGYPEVDMFESKVGKITNSIFHLKRGKIYTINGSTFFTMGGAESCDKINRTEHISWWREEVPSYGECSSALENLKCCGNKVDYIITHTGPDSTVDEIAKGSYLPARNFLTRFFEDIKNDIKFKHWYFGHMHENITIGNITCLYDKVAELSS